MDLAHSCWKASLSHLLSQSGRQRQQYAAAAVQPHLLHEVGQPQRPLVRKRAAEDGDGLCSPQILRQVGTMLSTPGSTRCQTPPAPSAPSIFGLASTTASSPILVISRPLQQGPAQPVHALCVSGAIDLTFRLGGSGSSCCCVPFMDLQRLPSKLSSRSVLEPPKLM